MRHTNKLATLLFAAMGCIYGQLTTTAAEKKKLQNQSYSYFQGTSNSMSATPNLTGHLNIRKKAP